MLTNSDAAATTNTRYSINGTVRNQYQQPMPDAMVRAFDKDIRTEQSLGEVQTNEQGFYQIYYSQENFVYTDKEFADVLLRVYDANGTLLKQTDVYYNAPAELKIDISLSSQTYKGISEFEQVYATVTPYIGRLTLATLTETAETPDITFLVNKTGLQRDRIEALAMAYRFESQTKIEAVVFYGLLREGVPSNIIQQLLQSIAAPTYEQQAQQKLDGIMHENIDVLMQALRQAINDNIVPYSLGAALEKIKAELLRIISGYAQQNPQTGNTSPIFQKINIAGLSEDDSKKVTELLAQHQGSIQSFFSALTSHETLAGNADQLNAIFQLSDLANNNIQLTSTLVKDQQIKNADDIKKLAANTTADWENILKEKNIDAPSSTKDQTIGERIKNFAIKLEKNFTKKFPTTAFASRLKQDANIKTHEQNKLVNFFDVHPDFDLQNHRIETYITDNAKNISDEDKPVIAGQLRRLQRVFKLAPTYAASQALLDKGIHSSAQVYAMGKDRFAQTFASQLGKKETQQIFANASKMYAQTVAVAGNMHGLATASKLKVLPDYQGIMKLSPAAQEIPNLDVLFQHADFCECEECRSVYGAASYLTDALHFLSKRMTTGGDTVRDKLLQRRPDIGDIDLNCDNTNTELPYIDIVNEILEETISPTIFSIASAFTANLPVFVPLVNTDPLPDEQHVIDAALLSELISHTADIPHIDLLLTANAMVSDAYQAMGSSSTQWIIRDKNIVLDLMQNAADISVQLLHQTLLSADDLSANPEYTNVKVYDNFLKTAKRPFGLPFDLFSTEGEIYLTKLGVSKADLIRLFARENLPVTNPPASELNEAYAYLDVSMEERALIFTEDLINQIDYWGTLASSASVEVDLFLNYTGLAYADLMTLLTLEFINPALDSKIDHDNLSCDLDTQHITNVTAEKFDHIHRFLRLWKKTSLTLQELDACIRCLKIGDGKIDENFAWQFHAFLQLKDRFDLDVFPLLAFYEDIQTSGVDNNLYNNLFQNKQITYPLNSDFSLVNVNSGIAITEIHKSIIQAATFITPVDMNTLLADNSITTLSLANLSLIYRDSLLMQAQSFTADDLRIATQVIPVDVFASPVDTMDFLAKNDLLNNAGISVWELNYILRQQNDLNQTLIPTDVSITTNLGELQDALLLINTNTSVQPDANGDLLTKWLNDPLLKWDATISARLINILKTIDDDEYNTIISSNYTFLKNLRVQYDAPFHETMLSVLNPIENLSQLSANISYNSGTKQLSFTGAMTANEQATLLAAFTDQDWQNAIDFLNTNPNGSTTLEALPLLTSYASSSGQLLFNNATKTLRFIGYMDATLRDALKNFYNNPNPIRDALDSLFDAQLTDNSAANIFFASDADVDTNLKALEYAHIADRFAFFLQKISPAYATMQQQAAIQNRISTWFTVDKTISAQLLISVPAIFTDFSNNAFIQKTNALSSANYPAQYDQYLWLAKIGFIITKLKIDANALSWILIHAADVDITDLSTLPIVAVVTPVSQTDFDAFENLINLISLHHSYAATSTNTIFNVFQDVIDGIKTIDDLETEFSDLYAWDKGQLKTLIEVPNYLNLITSPAASSDLKNIRILVRLYKCFATMQLLGVAAEDCINWSKPSLSFDDSTKIKQTLKSRYSDSDWLDVTMPLQNKLRESKRDALVTYLLANPGTNAWKDANDLYSYFLIDVEMSACQPTSRIVQATNSVQQFVQRCFMSMEADIIVNADDPDQQQFDSKWSQWEWMSQYRLWEANRKVFLYPENWIEPELLPGQSSFFKDLQNDLLQNEVTQTNVEDAFMSYLEKLDGVAHLEIKGMWYEDDNQTLHVIGRTYGGDPKIYYYRQYIENRRWTAWEKIDLDINSDHVIPVVFNQRLYIFWAVFTEKGREAPDGQQVPDLNESNFPVRKPDKYLQIQMAFSEYKNGKWSPKKISNNDSTGFIEDYQWMQNTVDPSIWYQVAPDKSRYFFSPVDLPVPDYSDLQAYIEKGDIKGWWEAFIDDIKDSLKQNGTLNLNCYYTDDNGYYDYKGTFDLDPCRGYPVVIYNYVSVNLKLFTRSGLSNMLDDETNDTSNNFLAFPAQSSILNQTPGFFRNLIPLQAGFFDRWVYIMELILLSKYQFASDQRNPPITLGTFMPFFYQDASTRYEKTGRTYYVAPEISDNDEFELFYSDLEAWFLQLLDLLKAIIEGDTAAQDEIRKAMPQIPEGKRILMLYHFYNFYHPQVCFFMRQLFNKGIDGLMSRQTQLKGDIAYDNDASKFNFNTTYQPQFDVYSGSPVTYPNAVVDATPGYPREDVDFNIQAGYSLYNWELFFHAPLMIAERLSENQQFDDADKWFKYIFNPTDSSAYPAPDKFWVTKPFFMNVVDVSGKTKYDLQRIENIMFGIADPSVAHPNDLDKSVEDWRENPFQPHYIAQYRTVAYQKTTVMKYLDHLIRWGDYLFTQHTMESVTQATQLYVLAAQILGPEPKIIPPAYEVPVNNYYQLEKKLDSFSNVLVEIENLLPMHTYKGFDYSNPDNPDLPSLQSLYYCIPFNDNILQYWTTIADRLFKIRHCLDIEGVFSPLSLFAPPIDPGMLVRATAAGLDLSSVLNDLNAPLPLYRFVIIIQKATELCNEVKSLGGALLAALEKKDAEHLSLLRSSHEIKLLSAVLQMKQTQITEAQNQIDNLTKQKELTTIKRDYYQNLLSSGLSTGENIALALNTASTVIDTGIAIGYTLAGGLKMIPDFILGASGFGGSPHATVATGGKSFGDSAEDAVRTLQSIATALDKNASLMSTNASYARRTQEWANQLNLANKELDQIDVQILGAQIRLDIANKDKDNQQLQIDNAKEDDDFMHSKFTNEDLYAWMISKLSTTYFQSYNLAYNAAKKAEQCFRYELGLSDSAYVQFGYWDSMKKGLLSGESLMYNLKQMEMAYYEKNKREYELTKHVSLSQLDAVALLQLKETGQCFINLPEEIFDIDYPGHYFRRIKSVSLSIPCVAGPYTTIGATLTLMNNTLRIDGTSVTDAKKYPRKSVNGIPADDPRFRDSGGTSQSIVLSHAQTDSGLFELNFRDERYLPFEGSGAISKWHLQFPFANTKDKSGTKVNTLLQQFDYNTISDVIIQLKYTAREGGDAIKANASDNLVNNINKMLVSLKDTGLSQLFSLKHEFPTEWYAFLNQPDVNTGDQTCAIQIDTNRLPFFVSQSNVKITSISLYADAINPTPQLHITSPGNITNNNFSFAANPGFGSLLVAGPVSQSWGNNTLGQWKIIKPGNTPLTSNDLKDIYVLIKYSVG